MKKIPILKKHHLFNYLVYEDYELVCRKQLHTNTINTPPRHGHKDFYELVVVKSGRGVHRYRESDWHISQGCVFLIEPNSFHEYVKYDNLEIFNLLFSRKFLRYIEDDLSQLDGFQLIFNLKTHQLQREPDDGIHITPEHIPDIIAVLEEMDALNTAPQAGDKTLLLGNFMRVMLLLSRYSSWSGQPSQLKHIDRLTRFMAELEKNFDQDWNLSQMAEANNMSISSFRQEFRKLTGSSPINYLLELRLGKASRMLLAGKSVEEVAFACGFNDVNYFSRQFKRRYNVTPRQWQH